MNFKKAGLNTFLAAGIFFSGICAADASKLPDDVWAFIKKEIPGANQRFDSVIMVDSNSMYIPLYPAQRKDVAALAVEYTYPQGKKLSNGPEVFILNNNYAFLKVFKDKSGNYTVTKNENLPEKVKLGVMPQDMLVPTGLKIPESLKITMGNLSAPNRGDNLIITASDTTVGTEDDETSDIVPIVELRNTKAFFVNDKTKFVLVYDKGGTKPLYEIKLSGLPSKIVASPLTKFALTMYFGSKTAEVIDLVNERVLTKIDFDNIPSDADLDARSQTAYVTSAKAGAIYLVDLNSASLAKTVKTDRAPDKISVSGADGVFVFSDKNNENIYMADMATFTIKKIGNVKNLSRLLIGNGKILAISRTQNKAYIYALGNFRDDNPANLINELTLAEKPTDALIYGNKAFILCSKDGIINVYDLAGDKMLEPVKLEGEGFYSKITRVPNKNNAVVTGLNTKKAIIINLDTAQKERKAACDIDVSELVIVDDAAPVVPDTVQKAKPKKSKEENI